MREHRIVIHVVPVQHVVLVGKISRIVGCQENGPLMNDSPGIAREVLLQIFLVRIALNNRIVYARARHVNPCHRIGVLRKKSIPINRHSRESVGLFFGKSLFGNGGVHLAAMPVAVANHAEHGKA